MVSGGSLGRASHASRGPDWTFHCSTESIAAQLATDGLISVEMWPILQFAYMGVLAYVGAFIAFHAIG